MPASNHLDWFEVREFGGLWTAGANSQMPADKAQVMSGCHPQPGGGLRAFLRPVDTIDGTDLDTVANTLPVGAMLPAGFFVHTVGAQNGEPSQVIHMLTTAGPNSLDLRASTAVISTPDTAALDISGDIDLRVKTRRGSWTAAFTMISKLDPAAFTGYELSVDASRVITLSWGDGAAVHSVSATAAFSNYSEPVVVKATLDVDNGAAGHDVRFYVAPVGSDTWTQVGSTVTTAGVTSIANGDEALTIGRRPGVGGSMPSNTQVFWAQVRNGIDGTVVANADFTILDATDDPTSFVDLTGLTWTFSTAGPDITLQTHNYGLRGLNEWHMWQVHTNDDSSFKEWKHVATGFDGSYSFLSTPRPGQPSFVVFDSEEYLAVAIEENGDVSGIYVVDWKVALDTPSATRNSTTDEFADSNGARALVVHQSRLVAGERDFIRFSAPGTADFTAAGSGYVQLNPAGYTTSEAGYYNWGALVAWMLPIPPGDLLVATIDGRLYNIQGDLGDPTVRDLGSWQGMAAQQPARLGASAMAILPSRGVVEITPDGNLAPISEGIDPQVWNVVDPQVGVGQLVGTDRYLFAPNQHPGDDHSNGPLVYDRRTSAWFTASHSDDAIITNPRFMHTDDDPQESSIWVLSGVSPQAQGLDQPLIFRYPAGGGYEVSGGTEPRAETWEWKSAPFREPGGRQLIIREVQIPAYAFNDDTSTLAITVNGTTRNVTLPAGRSVQKVLFNERGENLDITVKAKSNEADVEAPMIDAVRVGWRSGPLL